jgi:outer membrane receptor protein involved in Fe transport
LTRFALLCLLVALSSAGASLAAPSDSTVVDSAAAVHDSTHAPRVVRRFPEVEVRAPLYDLRSSQTVHVMDEAALRSMPVDCLEDLLALQPGVVAQGEELHVRGGRTGESVVVLEGLSLNEPILHHAMSLPMLALKSANLVSGVPEAQYGGGLAGVIDVATLDPTEKPSFEWRWQTDGGLDTRYDRVGARGSAPLGVLGLGAMAAVDATFDDTWLPALRTKSQHEVAGIPLGWRAENRMLYYLKLAPVAHPSRFDLQAAASRQVHEPFDPMWSLDGWTMKPTNGKDAPVFSPDSLPGYDRFIAADRLGIAEDDHFAALLSVHRLGDGPQGTASLGWFRTRSVYSFGGGHESGITHHARFGNPADPDIFHVLGGEDPLYRESGSDVFMLRSDVRGEPRPGASVRAGLGATYEQVSLREMDWLPFGFDPGGDPLSQPLDSLRSYQAYAPGGFAYVQGRWLNGGMILNGGLRAEYWTAGPQADRQTLPGDARGFVTLSPHLGLAYPITVRDVFSVGYVRLHQPPARDDLYDQRIAITNRQPLGNPGLTPATAISYEAAVKHLFGASWSLQTSVFYRDLYGQVGARSIAIPQGPTNLVYVDQDEGTAVGLEWSLIQAVGTRRRFEIDYTWMEAWGNESRSEGDPYGTVRSLRGPAIADTPLSWDRRHSLLLAGSWQRSEQWSLSWLTAIGSALPWTPKDRRKVPTDPALVNSQRLNWAEMTHLDLRWRPRGGKGLALGLEVRNLFDHRTEHAATVDGYPNPYVNSTYDDYGAYRTETGNTGGAYLFSPEFGSPYWVPVHDPRMFDPPRLVRMSVGSRW